MAGWIKYRLNTPRAQVRMDKKEFQNLKENLIYYKAALDGAYDNLVLKYEEEFAELFMETDACIRHKYIFSETTGELVIKPSVCKCFKNGDIHCAMPECECARNNYMYCALKEQVADLQAEYDSFWKNKFKQKNK